MRAAFSPLKGRKRRAHQSDTIRDFASGYPNALITLYLLEFRLTEESAGLHEKYQDQDDKRIGVLIFA